MLWYIYESRIDQKIDNRSYIPMLKVQLLVLIWTGRLASTELLVQFVIEPKIAKT